MANYNYKRGYSVDELKALLADAKIEREKVLASASDSGSSYSRVAQAEIEKKIGGILDALELLCPAEFKRRTPRVTFSRVVGRPII